MLVITRDIDQEIRIGDNVKVRIIDVNGTKVRLGIIAPAEVAVNREEIARVMEQEKGAHGTRSLAHRRKPKGEPPETG